jgi:hypothetical protein
VDISPLTLHFTVDCNNAGSSTSGENRPEQSVVGWIIEMMYAPLATFVGVIRFE